MSSLWGFTDLVPKRRRDKLVAVASFDVVISRIAAGTVDSFKADPRRNPPCLGCSRAFFRIRVRECDYDAFFNSPVGYRAQYCIALEHGQKQNRRLIEAVTPRCLEFQRQYKLGEFPEAMVLASLRGSDAKVWINDADLPDVDEVHIDYPPWVVKARAAASGTLADQAARASAASGVLAPEGTHIEVKGAWITPNGEECRDPSKAHRAQEIRDYGYA